MARTHLTKKQIRAPYNAANCDAISTKSDDFDDTLDALVVGSAGFLTADADGRAVMATGYFTEAAATDKFAAGAIDGATLLKAASVTQAKLAAVLCSAPTTRSGAGAVAITSPTCLVTSTGVGDALTVADATVSGHRLRIVHIVDGGTAVITQTTGAKLTAAISTITFTNAYDWVELEWSGALWNVIGYGGVTIA